MADESEQNGVEPPVPHKFLSSSGFWVAAACWAVGIAVLWGVDLAAKLLERNQQGIGKDTFRLVAEQATSAAAVLILVLFVLRWLELFPLQRRVWRAALPGHLAGSALFAIGHQALMVIFRIPLFAAFGERYVWWEPFLSNLLVEYQKDLKIYLAILVILTAYRLYLGTRLSREPAPAVDRLEVQTGRGTRVVRLAEIDYLEAAKNYVSVHAGGREYLIRETLSSLHRRLQSSGFVRTHRSYVVNLSRVEELRSADSGWLVALTGGQTVPVSRPYREILNAALISGRAGIR